MAIRISLMLCTIAFLFASGCPCQRAAWQHDRSRGREERRTRRCYSKENGGDSGARGAQPQPAHLVSKQNPAAKVAEFPSPHPEYKAERLQTPENSPIAMRRYRIKAPSDRRIMMPRGDKSKYTDKRERKAAHIAEGYRRVDSGAEADAGPGQPSTKRMAAARSPAGLAAASPRAIRRCSLGLPLTSECSASAKKAAATRKRNAEQHPDQPDQGATCSRR